MEMTNVQSSQIAAVGHNGESTLHILFRRGGLYEYDNVSAQEYDDLLRAESIGSHFGKHIKGVKPWKKVEGNPLPAKQDVPAAESATELVPQAKAAIVLDAEEVKRHATELVPQAKAVIVTDVISDKRAKEMLLAVRGARKEIADTFDPDIKRWHEGHKAAIATKKKFDDPLEECDRYLNSQINSYALAEIRRAREAEEAARAKAKAEAEEAARKEAERLALDDAIALEKEGKTEEAEAVLANPVPVQPHYVAPAPIAPQLSTVKGVSSPRLVWDFRITDETMIPREYLLVNESAIRAIVQRTNGKIRIPGVEAFERASTSASRRG